MSTRGWLTLTRTAEAAGVAPEILRAGVECGRLEGWYQTVGGQLKFKPATVEFVRWSDRLADAVLNWGCERERGGAAPGPPVPPTQSRTSEVTRPPAA